MPIFIYKGYDVATGESRKGKIEAESLRAARQKLKTKDRIIASDLREEIVASSKNSTTASRFFQAKVSITELAIMTRQFATLQNAHVPLDECLLALVQQVDNVVLSNTLSAVKDAVSEGKSLGDALTPYPQIFNRLYINMIRAGESSGSLGLVLERLADFQEYQVEVQGKVVSSMTYPALMIFASLGIIAYLFISVVPKLQKVFDSLHVTLPWYTLSLISFSEFLQHRWYVLVIVGIGLVFLAKSWYATPKGRWICDKYSLSLPLFGPVVMRVNISKFTKTLSTLLGSGVPIISALEITKNVVGNVLIAKAIEEAKISVQEGDSLGLTLEKSKQFPALVTHMIRTGEKTGELETMLKHVAEAYDAEVSRKIDALTSIIEPLMIIFMGGIVVVVVFAMLVPMLSVMSQMR